MNEKDLSVLGQKYKVKELSYAENKEFKEMDCAGYCNGNTKAIFVCKMSTYPGWENAEEESLKEEQRRILRHEIVHAFLHESGLSSNSSECLDGWARNEEMIDWFALQGPKIYKTWKEAEALSERR